LAYMRARRAISMGRRSFCKRRTAVRADWRRSAVQPTPLS
jgi:hypothetical protein